MNEHLSSSSSSLSSSSSSSSSSESDCTRAQLTRRSLEFLEETQIKLDAQEERYPYLCINENRIQINALEQDEQPIWEYVYRCLRWGEKVAAKEAIKQTIEAMGVR